MHLDRHRLRDSVLMLTFQAEGTGGSGDGGDDVGREGLPSSDSDWTWAQWIAS